MECSDVVSGKCSIEVADCHCEGQCPRVFISGGERDNKNSGEPLAALVYKAASGIPDKILFEGERFHSIGPCVRNKASGIGGVSLFSQINVFNFSIESNKMTLHSILVS